MESYIGEIKLWALTFAPKGWALCDGSVLSISQNTALYSLLSNHYGGDGVQNFALPDLRGRVPVAGQPAQIGAKGGNETVTLSTQQVPPHSHPVNVYPNAANQPAGLGHHIAAAVTTGTQATNLNLYAPSSGATLPLSPEMLSKTGAGAAHDNMQPWLALNYYIATSGIYPSRP